MHGYEVVEGQIRPISSERVSQQVRILQFTPAKSGRRPFSLQRSDRDSGLRRNSIEVRSTRSKSAKHQNECRYDYT